jgi:TonB family protein
MRSLSAFFLVAIVASGLPLSAQTADAQGRATPNFVRNPAPVYPYALLIEGREGSAEVQFTVEYSGRAIFASVTKSTAPEFGKALVAEIESNEFIPPRVNGQPKLSQAAYSHAFKTAALDATAREILAELRKPMPAIAAADTLDKKPAPTRQDPPVYPYSLQSDGISGRAEIEIVIDRTGRVLFPRVVSATNDDIGYAAAAAVARQRYQPPMKGGQAVHARMTVTVSYDKDKMAASW